MNIHELSNIMSAAESIKKLCKMAQKAFFLVKNKHLQKQITQILDKMLYHSSYLHSSTYYR